MYIVMVYLLFLQHKKFNPMKKLNTFIVALCFGLFASLSAQAQFFTNDAKTTWLGIDFSRLQFEGDFTQFKDAGAMTPTQIRDKYFDSWNSLIRDEPKKFNLEEALQKNEVVREVDFFKSKNAQSNPKSVSSSTEFSQSDIKKYVSGYNFKGKSGYGALMIAESFRKDAKEGAFHFVVVDMSSRRIVAQERIVADAGGFGMRNYWAGAISNAIKEIKKSSYKKWSKNQSEGEALEEPSSPKSDNAKSGAKKPAPKKKK